MSKWKSAVESLYNKGKEVATNIYLSGAPSSDLYGSRHIKNLNEKLDPTPYSIIKDKVIGETTYQGYWVYKWQEEVHYAKDSDSLNNFLEKNLNKELGWKETSPSLLSPERVKQIMTPAPAIDVKVKGKFLAPEALDAALKKTPSLNKTRTMERAL